MCQCCTEKKKKEALLVLFLPGPAHLVGVAFQVSSLKHKLKGVFKNYQVVTQYPRQKYGAHARPFLLLSPLANRLLLILSLLNLLVAPFSSVTTPLPWPGDSPSLVVLNSPSLPSLSSSLPCTLLLAWSFRILTTSFYFLRDSMSVEIRQTRFEP